MPPPPVSSDADGGASALDLDARDAKLNGAEFGDENPLASFTEFADREIPGAVSSAVRLLRGAAVFATIDSGDFPNRKSRASMQRRLEERIFLRRLAAKVAGEGSHTSRSMRTDLA
jgi:hypothetical protein